MAGSARKFLRFATVVIVLWVGSYSQDVSAQTQTDLNLVIAFDCSFSVDAREFALQVNGTAEAFLDPQVLEAITSGRHGKISVSVVQWSSAASQVVTVPWTTISGKYDAIELVHAIRSQPRLTADGGTSISAALSYSNELLREAPTLSSRNVIDMAADGTNNTGPYVESARNAVVSDGVTINGLVILNDIRSLALYFESRVIGGAGAFVQVSHSYEDYAEAFRKKLLREIKGLPVS